MLLAMSWAAAMLVRIVVFGVAIALVARWNPGIRVKPRRMLPVVAGTFALLNVGLYWLLAVAVSVGSLLTLALVAPFLANAILLWTTSKLIKALEIDGFMALGYAALVITLVHLALRLVGL